MAERRNAHLAVDEVIAAAAGGLRDPVAIAHWRECPDCIRDVSEWESACAELSHLRTGPTPVGECPPMEVLAGFASGGPEAQDEPTRTHIMQCGRCAAILRDAFESEDVANPTPNNVIELKPKKPKWVAYSYAAAAALLLASFGTWWLLHSSFQPEHLLAEAYTSRRPFEYRLPDAGYAPVRQERGAAGSTFDRPEALVSAEAAARKELAADPNDPEALRLKGITQLLEQDYDGSIDSLKEAALKRPNDLDLLADLGTAYAVRGDVEKNHQDYGEAMERFLHVLKHKPNDERILFNLALTYEKLWLVDEAIDTWRKVIALNPPEGWLHEAQTHLAAMEQIRKNKQKADGAAIHDPAQFLASRPSGSPFDPLAYHEIVWKEWLPKAAEDQAALQASAVIARALKTQIRDPALEVTVEQLLKNRNCKGFALLAQAMIDNQSGGTDVAAEEASQAARILAADGFNIAAARAHIELAYADRWANKYQECEQLTEEAARFLDGRYPWLAGTAHLEHAACVGRAGQDGQERSENSKAFATLSGQKIWPVALRAQGFVLSVDAFDGNYGAVWQNGVEGLRAYWTTSASLLRAQAFQVFLGQAAYILGLRESAVVLYRATIRSAHLAGNGELEAVNEASLAALYRVTGDQKSEVVELRVAEKALANIGVGQRKPVAADHLRWEAKLERLEAEVRANDPGTIDLARIQSDLNELRAQAHSEIVSDQIRLEQLSGSVLAAAGKWREAEPEFEKALQMTKADAESFPDWVNRMPVFEIAAPACQTLTQIQLRQEHNPAQALETWQLCRPVSSRGSLNNVLVTMAELPAGIVVWKQSAGQVSARWVNAGAASVHAAVDNFLEMCSSPNSSEREIKLLGSRIFQWLLAPELGSNSEAPVMVSADSWLAAIPFGALSDSHGEYLFARRAFTKVYGPALQADPASGSIPLDALALVVYAPNGAMPGRRVLPFLSSAQQEASEVASHFPHATVLREPPTEEVIRQMSDASIFHFSGHGWANGGNGGLILSASGPATEARYLSANSLVGKKWPRCELVVLSACLTATGEGKGVVNNQSLVQALFGTGARRIVAARWSVDSEASRALMGRFYHALAKGKKVSQALAEAANETARTSGNAHPYYWAGFEAYGAI